MYKCTDARFAFAKAAVFRDLMSTSAQKLYSLCQVLVVCIGCYQISCEPSDSKRQASFRCDI